MRPPAQSSVVGQGFDVEVIVNADGTFAGGDVAGVPEPGTLALFSLGLVGIGAIRRLRNSAVVA
ncbi:MAG: PEP-CTERM sorting domain-containing protein [Alphaproteobacteria bacterium]|nr:PEP-CTERM sorting domain-containing protein [Alphaproteobacteria bacterium]